ncbi:MAG: transcriptional regulator [Caldisphaeraceae archaeon]|nr:transcriptional regulator [Caldisphaeraceae archaeon]MEB3692271.1 transcriptional regulator [Caldisphaeraceae archaeon]MEB3798306.1 transcriptional regulator [Caldisphaeraceae archaeon]
MAVAKKMEMPCEVAARMIIPSIRASIAYILVKEFGLSKYTAAKLLDLTPAAINNYISGKRGDRFMKSFLENKVYLEKIRYMAMLILKLHSDSKVDREAILNAYQDSICDVCSRVNEIAIKRGCPYIRLQH